MATSIAGVFLGVLLGLRHALEPDHLAALTVLSTERPDPRRGALLGAFWGLGHTLALVVVALLLTALHTRMPPRLGAAFELAVAAMLVLLGIRALVRALRDGRGGPVTSHAHLGGTHVHGGPTGHLHLGRWTFARRPFAVGLVHGLAGSGALTAMVVASISTTAARLLFVALFGLGSVLGMAVPSGLAGFPLARAGRRPRVSTALSAAAGMLSTSLGVVWGWPLVGQVMGAP